MLSYIPYRIFTVFLRYAFCANTMHVNRMLILYVLLVYLFEITVFVCSLFVVTSFNIYQDCLSINFQAWSMNCLFCVLVLAVYKTKPSMAYCGVLFVLFFLFQRLLKCCCFETFHWNQPFMRWQLFSSAIILKISLVCGIWTCRLSHIYSSSKHFGEMETSPCCLGDGGDTSELTQCRGEEN